MLQQPSSDQDKPPSPQTLLQLILHTDFSGSHCLQSLSENKLGLAEQKLRLKQQISEIQTSKKEYVSALQKKRRLKAQLKQLLNFRQSADYDRNFKSTKFNHHHFPYSDNLYIKEELNRLRLQNLQKKRKIKELQEEIKRKQRQVELRRIQKQNIAFATFRDNQIPQRDNNREDIWLSRIENIKHRYLSQGEEFKRAKIRHDYNLFVQTQCGCNGGKSCVICSDVRGEQRVSYRKEMLLSPRYRSIYGSHF